PATELCPLSLHDALPICLHVVADDGAVVGAFDGVAVVVDLLQQFDEGLGLKRLLAVCAELALGRVEWGRQAEQERGGQGEGAQLDRKSTRLNSSHVKISY